MAKSVAICICAFLLHEPTLSILSSSFKGIDQWERRWVVSFERSGFKLFTLWFSNILDRPKTTQWTMFLSYEINNLFQTRPQYRHSSHIKHFTETTVLESSPVTRKRKESAVHHKSVQTTRQKAENPPVIFWTVGKEVWIEHVACKFPWFFHTPPTLCR